MSGRRAVGASVGLLVILLLAAPFLAPSSAGAHALLVSSTPADGASYDRAPSEVRLVFSEEVQLAATSVELFDGAGRPVAVGVPVADEGADDATVVRVALGPLPRDRYLVRWRTISSDDLHPNASSIVFGIGTDVTAATVEAPSGWTLAGTIAESVIRWLALLALGLALAARVLSRRLTGSISRDGPLSPVLPRTTAAMAGLGALAAAALGLLYLGRVVQTAGLAFAVTSWGSTARWVVAIASAALAWWMLRRTGRRSRTPDGIAPSALLVVSLAAVTSTSHAMSAGLAAAALGALHTVATMLWVCGAVIVAILVVPALRRRDRVAAVTVARAFTPIALVAVPVSLVTGLLLAGRLLPSVGAVLNTDYGHTLLVKLGLLVLGLGLAASSFVLLVLRGGRRRGAAAVGAEAVVLCTVVLAASAVAATPPPSAVVWAPSADQAPTAGVLSEMANDLVLTVDVGPGRPGRNFVTIGVLDTRRPAPAPISSVEVSVGTQAPLTAVAQGHFQWLATTSIEGEGPTDLAVTVRRAGEPTVAVPFRWLVGPPVGTRRGGAELAPITGVAAAAIAVVGLLGWVLYGAARRRARVRRPGMVREPEAVHAAESP